MTQTISVSARVEAFLDDLQHTTEEFTQHVPGLPGVWEVKWLRLGLEKSWIAVHHSGQCLALTPTSDALFKAMKAADLRSPLAARQFPVLPKPRQAWEDF